MRNFKKFLALVLAMLMVSACAVSVSAYTDDGAIRASGYAEAVEVLSSLGVISGTDTGAFNPNGTLTRAAAAKIVAMLDTGAAGRNIEWKAGSSSFADVDVAHWGAAYINYASQHGIMDGIGDGNFAPDADLTIAEAIAIAVKAAGLKAEVAKLNELGAPAYWATNWIAVADDNGLTANITVFDYSAICSRAMFAQVAYNILNNVESIQKGYGLEKVTATITSVADGKVTLSDGKVVGLGAMNDALAAAGVEVTADALKGYIVTLTYSSTENIIYGVSLDSDAVVYSYADGKIANVKDSNDALTNNIKIDGVTYAVAAEDTTDTGIIGSTTSSKGITVIVEGTAWEAAEALPTYYAAVAYDDDNDNDFDRLVIDTYAIATVDFDSADKNDDGVKFDTIKYIDGSSWTNKIADNEKAINYTGVAVANEEIPVLVDVDWNADTSKWDVDVLEAAAVVSGKLVGIGADYVNIDGTKYSFVAGAEAVATWTLNQTVSIYTIGGKYVKVVSASASDIEVVVNSAVVTDGKAVITGYNKSASYADITITVEGIEAAGKLYSRSAKQNTAKDSDDKEYNTTVELGKYDGDDWKTEYVLAEGAIIALKQTAAGAYLTAINGTIDALGEAATADKFAVKGGYVYLNEVASKYVADGAVIIEEVVDADAKAGSYAAVTYNKLAAFSERAEVSYRYTTKDGKVNFIFVEAGHKATTTITETKALAEGQAIIFVKDATIVEATYNATIYNAINLMTGEKVQVSSTISVEAGKYYIINANNEVVEDTTGKWIGNYVVNVEYSGLVGVVKAQAIVKYHDSSDDSITYAQAGDVLTYGLDNITIYNAGVLDADGNVSKANVSDTLMTGATHAVAGDIYVVAGQMIIVLK